MPRHRPLDGFAIFAPLDGGSLRYLGTYAAEDAREARMAALQRVREDYPEQHWRGSDLKAVREGGTFRPGKT